MICLQCPRHCGVDRSLKTGFCRESDAIRAAWAGLHFGEEPPITVFGGSGTIFITGCNLRCCFCQNIQISQQGMGAPLSRDAFADLCLKLQAEGAENINIVTGSHHPSALAEALVKAKDRGLNIPVCWNCSGYETVDAVRRLADVVDIWLPDLKTLDTGLAGAAFSAPDYPEKAKGALLAMSATPTDVKAVCNDDGTFAEKMFKGMIVRHLVLPGRLEDTRHVLEWFDRHLRGKAMLSLMTQYTPIPDSSKPPFENRYLSEREYEALIDLLDRRDDDGFFQELVQDDEWLPDFNRREPFSSLLARGLWHWKYGFLSR